MGFLDAGRDVGGHLDAQVADSGHLTAAAAGESDGDRAAGFGRLQGFEDVGAVAGGRKADDDVARPGQRLDLAGEHGVEAVVVADSREDGGVGGEGDGRQAAALLLEAADEFGGQVLAVGGAAAVAHEEDAVAVLHRPGEDGAQLHDVIERAAARGVDRLLMLSEDL